MRPLLSRRSTEKDMEMAHISSPPDPTLITARSQEPLALGKQDGGRLEEQRLQGADMETDYRPVNWKKLLFGPKYLPWHILGLGILIATVLLTIKHDEVVAKLRPWSEKVRDLPAGWLIPIAILVVISFPPLFGHELIALLCGVVYGLWIGFGIVAAGTFIGEVGTWFAFRYLFRRKARQLERTNLNYGALARLTRDGGFVIVLIIRLSAVPAHFSTAVFSTCNVRFWHFCVATLLSLPKQIFLVYLGVLLVQSEAENHSSDGWIKTAMFGAVGVLTVILGVWIWKKMANIKKILLEEQEQRQMASARSIEIVPSVESAFQSVATRRRDDENTEDARVWGYHPAVPARLV